MALSLIFCAKTCICEKNVVILRENRNVHFMHTGVIYCWRNKTNGKRYIGQTFHEEKRKQSHILSSRKKYGGLSSFHTALREEGVENFVYEVLFRCEMEDKGVLQNILDDKEKYFIEKYNSHLTEYGYNETVNGQFRKISTNNANNQNKKLRLKNRKKKVEIEKEGKIVKVYKEPKETKKQIQERMEREAAAEWIGKLCNALGVPMASFEMVKPNIRPNND